MLLRISPTIRPCLVQSQRSLFYWIALQFNALDKDRRDKLGADRTCAEWILRNGGAVKWMNSSEILNDYNSLPTEGTRYHLEEIDASNASIMHNGFEHFKDCKFIKKLILHKCSYLEDKALAELYHLKDSLAHLQISDCGNITDAGLLHLNVLSKLDNMLLFNLTAVKNKEKTVQALKSVLPKCNIQFK